MVKDSGLPSSACSTDQIKAISGYWNSVQVFFSLDALHNLLENDQFRKATNGSAICSGISNDVRNILRFVSYTEREQAKWPGESNAFLRHCWESLGSSRLLAFQSKF